MKSTSPFLAAVLVMTLIIVPAAVAATYSLTVKTDLSSYTGSQRLIASGAVSPAPGNNTAVFLKILGPSGGTALAVGSAPVAGSTGTYQFFFTLGGTASWVAGTYTLAASWGNSVSGGTVNATTTFTYAPATTTTTTTTTTSTTTTTPTTTTTTTTTTSTTTSSTTQTTTTQTPPAGPRVTILNGTAANPSAPGYSPATITVVLGVNSTVTWVNNDVAIHTVTATDSSFNSGDLAPKAFYSHTFTAAGIYSYMCLYHNWMKGTVVVKAAGGTTSTTSTTTTSSSSTPSTTTTSTTSTTQSTTSSTPTSSGGGGIPEFPFQLLAVSLFTALVVGSYVLARRRPSAGGLLGRP